MSKSKYIAIQRGAQGALQWMGTGAQLFDHAEARRGATQQRTRLSV